MFKYIGRQWGKTYVFSEVDSSNELYMPYLTKKEIMLNNSELQDTLFLF